VLVGVVWFLSVAAEGVQLTRLAVRRTTGDGLELCCGCNWGAMVKVRIYEVFDSLCQDCLVAATLVL
jgi:hypothetical protein